MSSNSRMMVKPCWKAYSVSSFRWAGIEKPSFSCSVQPLLPLILCKERQALAEACKLLNWEFGPALAVTKEHLYRRFVLRWVKCKVLKQSREDGAVARCKCGILRVLPIGLEER